jgi:hypothetical protein
MNTATWREFPLRTKRLRSPVALNPGGFLFLGASETADYPPGLFRCINRVACVYQSTGLAGERLPPAPAIIWTCPSAGTWRVQYWDITGLFDVRCAGLPPENQSLLHERNRTKTQ